MKELSGLSTFLVSAKVEKQADSLQDWILLLCGFINWIYFFKMTHGRKQPPLLWSWWADVYRNSLPSGEGKKASSTQHKQPRWPGLVRTLAFGSYFIYHGFSSTSLPSVRLSSPASTSAGEASSQRSVMWGLHSHTGFGLGQSSLKPISHLQASCFSCLFLWAPPSLLPTFA